MKSPTRAVLLACCSLAVLLPANSATAVCEAGDRILTLGSGTVSEMGRPDSTIWSGPERFVIGLTCDAYGALVALTDRVDWIPRDGDGWGEAQSFNLKGVTGPMLVESGVAIVAGERRGQPFVAWINPDEKRPTVRYLTKPASCLTVSPDASWILVGAEDELRTFTVTDARSRVSFKFNEEITGCASFPGVAWVAIAMGSKVIAINPRDRPVRGTLPVRAEIELGAPAGEMAWLPDGRALVVWSEQAGALSVLQGSDLKLARSAMSTSPAVSSTSWGESTVVWATQDGAVERFEFDDADLAGFRPPPTSLVATQVAARPAESSKPSPIEREPAKSEPVLRAEITEPDPPQPDPPRPEPAPPAAARTGPAPTEPKIEPAPQPAPDPAPQRAPDPEPSPEPAVAAPKPEVTKPEVTEPRVSQPRVAETEAADSAPQPEPVRETPPVAKASPPPPEQPKRAEPARAQAQPKPLTGLMPALDGPRVVGSFTGQAELVAEVILLGPGSLLKEHARIVPVMRNGQRVFVADNLPPGRYRVVPMGQGGASLRAQPSFVNVQVEPNQGARVEFEIRGRLP